MNNDLPVGGDINRHRHETDWTAWGVALLAVLPMLVMYLLHFLCAPPGYVATGFLQPDMPSYMAEARAFFSDGFSLTYGLPFSADDTTPRIYFQPMMFVMGLARALTGAPPGLIFVSAGLISGLLMFRAAIEMAATFYRRPRDLPEWLAVLALLWGGGIVVLYSLGLLATATAGHQPVWFARALFAADAGDDAMWFLNLGRNVYFANEAFYHVLFFVAIVLFVRRRHGLTLAMLVLMSASHPITGIELLLILGAFSVWEFLFNRRTAPPAWFIAAGMMLTGLHVFYYMVALPLLSPEHRQVQAQFDVAWTLTITNILATYGPVTLLATIHLVRRHHWRLDISASNVRLLLAWFAVAFVLANHELFMTPRQPVHFTRGYIWSPLALLSLPVIEAGFRKAMAVRGGVRRLVLVSALMALILFDNAVFFARQYYLTGVHGDHIQQYLRQDAMAAIARLGQPDMRGRLLLSNDQPLAYMAIVYLPLRTWMSHGGLTPYAGQHEADLSRFFASGAEVDAWRDRPLVVVIDTHGDAELTERLKAAGFLPVAAYGHYEILTRTPQQA